MGEEGVQAGDEPVAAPPVAAPDQPPVVDPVRAAEALGQYHQHQKSPVQCADYSIAMAYNIWLDRSGLLPAARAATEHMTNADITPLIDSVSNGRFGDGSTTPYGIEGAFKQLGVPFRSDWWGNTDKLRGELEKGNTVVVSVGDLPILDDVERPYGHVMVAVGYDPAQNRYAFLDPAMTKSKVVWLSEAELKGKWWYDPFHPMWVMDKEQK